MPSNMPYHKRFHADELLVADDLTLEEHSALTRLMDRMYVMSGPLKDDIASLHHMLCCSPQKAKKLRAALIDKGHLQITEDGRLTVERVADQLKTYAEQAETLRKNGEKGGRKRAENAKKSNENNDGCQAKLERGLNQVRSQNHSDTEVSGPEPAPNEFDLGIQILVPAGLTEKAARSLIGKWRKNAGPDVLLEILSDVVDRQLREPAGYIEKAVRSRCPAGNRNTAGHMFALADQLEQRLGEQI